MWRARDATFTFYVMYLSPLTIRGLPFGKPFFQSYILPLFFSGLLSYLVGIKKRTSRRVGCKRDSSRYVLISPEIEFLCRPKLPYFFR